MLAPPGCLSAAGGGRSWPSGAASFVSIPTELLSQSELGCTGTPWGLPGACSPWPARTSSWLCLAALLPASRCRALSLYPASSPCPGPAGPSERCCPAPKGRFPWGAPGPRRIAAHAANPTSDTKEQRSALQSTAPGSPPASPAAPGRRGRALLPSPRDRGRLQPPLPPPLPQQHRASAGPGEILLFSLPNLRSLLGSCLAGRSAAAGFFSASSHRGVPGSCTRALPGEGRESETFPSWPGPSSARTWGGRPSPERPLPGSPCPYREVMMGLELRVPG